MKNRIIIIFLFKLIFFPAFAENLKIESKKISIDKNKEITIFEDQVVAITEDNNKIQSNFAELNRKSKNLILKDNVKLEDNKQNFIESNYAEYNEISRIFKSKGETKITTSENYLINGSDIIFDNKNKEISSNNAAILIDSSNNKIYLENFRYNSSTNIFKSIGYVKIDDYLDNTYEFSQIYIDTKKKEIVGTDIKAFLNQKSFKLSEKNKPRIFSNAIKIENNGKSVFQKSNFTLCDYRENDKCPPWEIRSTKMMHDNKKKTIYYNNALIKVYDIPIFYFPRISHPDPTVDRRSGFLPPSYSDTKNLGEGISIPYFFNLGSDKNFTLTNRLYLKENPLFIGEYHQAFKNSFLMADFGYTQGYKKTTVKKKAGEKSHFFSKFSKEFVGKNNSKNLFEANLQEVSNDKYLKLYKIKSNLVDFNSNTLDNSISFTRENDDSYFGLNASIYESISEDYNDKYEYIFPEITIDKNLLSSQKFGNFDFQTNLKVQNYDTNKASNFLINDFDWESNNLIFNSKINNTFLGKIRNINYEAKNIDIYKNDTTNELFGAVGLLSKVDFQKITDSLNHIISPKILLKLSPGSMRKETNGNVLTANNAFNLERVGNLNNFETGNTATVGFDYSIKKENIDRFNFSVAQIINERENKKLSSKSSMDEKLSDLVGEASLDLNEKFKINYKFALDQNYQDLNYSNLNSNLKFGNFNMDFDYIEENKHIGDQEYFKTKINYENRKNNFISFETKRNLITNSSEFYDLSYEYMNDCLRAGLVFRREFYNDSEIEPDNSLMFNITLIPFGNINSPKINK